MINLFLYTYNANFIQMICMFKEFKEFLIKGNMFDMVVGFIFGGAFATVVKSLVSNVVMPPIGQILGKVDFKNLFYALDGKEYASLKALEKAGVPAIKYGLFITDAISFTLLGLVMFIFVKVYNKMKKSKPEVAPTEKVCSECAMKIPLNAKVCAYCGNKNI